MITDPFQRKAYDAVSAALPFAIDPANITVEPECPIYRARSSCMTMPLV